MKTDKGHTYGAMVWLLSGLSLTIYAIIGLLGKSVYGVEELVSFVNSAQGHYIYFAAFISIFFEGLYFIGSFFPGATLVIIIAVVAQIMSIQTFIATIAVIFFWLECCRCSKYLRGI